MEEKDINVKERYRLLCREEKNLCVFQQHWWLDAVCGENNWDVILSVKNGQIVGALPYYFQQSGRKIRILTPQLTQSIGVWIKGSRSAKYEKRLSHEMAVLEDLICQLEKLPLLSCQLQNNIKLTNWLPFYWKGFSQTTYYSYRIEDLSDMENVRAGFADMKKKNINKALKERIQVQFDLTAEDFYENHVLTLGKQGRKITYSYRLFERIYKAAYEHGGGRTIYAVDEAGNLHGALFVIWDEESGFDLISTFDPDYRNSGASTLLVYEMMKYLSSIGIKAFDFEGSMIPGVEDSFRHFGARQTPYFRIWKEYGNKFEIWADKAVRRIGSIMRR